MTSFDSSRYEFSLQVEQQPQRARMCGIYASSIFDRVREVISLGFGDKDRRPITPPPCVRLRTIDKISGSAIDITHVDSPIFSSAPLLIG